MEDVNVANFLCQDQMRDPLTVVNSYLVNPSPLRLTCTFMVKSYSHGIYLEATQHLPSIVLMPLGGNTTTEEEGDEGEDDEERAFPVTWRKLNNVQADGFDSFKTKSIHLRLMDLHCLTSIDKSILFEMTSDEKSAIRKLEGKNQTPSVSMTLARMPKLSRIGSRIISNRLDVTALTLEDLPELKTIGDTFCHYLSIKTLKFGNLPNLRSIEGNFVHQCEELESVTFENLPMLETIGSHFLSYAKVLKRLSLSDLPKLRKIDYCCMYSSVGIEDVVFRDLPSLETIERFCLGSELDKLVSLELVNLPNLETIGEEFAHQASNLKKAVYKDLPKLAEVGDQWMMRSTSDCDVTISNVPKLQYQRDSISRPKEFKWMLNAKLQDGCDPKMFNN